MKLRDKQTGLTSLWEEDGDLEKMKAFFRTIDKDLKNIELIKTDVKQKVIDKIAKDEPLGDFSIINKKSLAQRMRTSIRTLTRTLQPKIIVSVAFLVILAIIGKNVSNGSWTLSPYMGNAEKSTPSSAVTPGTPVAGGAAHDNSAMQYSSSIPSSTSATPAQKDTIIGGTSDNTSKNTANSAPDFNTAQSLAPPTDSKIARKITQDLTLTLEVTTINDTITEINRQVSLLGGYVSTSQQDGSDKHSTAQMTLKIPVDKLNGLRDSFISWGKVLDQRMVANDITNQYYDSQTRLQTLEAEEKRYLDILNQAKTVDDVLKVENSLGNIRQQIEQLKGQLQLWNNLLDYSTVNLQLVTRQDANVSVDNPWQPISWSKTWQATEDAVLKTISSSWNLLNYLVVGIGYVFPYLLLGTIVWGIYFVLKRRKSE